MRKYWKHLTSMIEPMMSTSTILVIGLFRHAADAWLLSPPCQPYTRQGLQKHSADARASSFVKILELIPQMQLPPKMLFIENVVGFEVSDTRKHMLGIFARTCFVTQEYILSPLQFGIPYSRPRYFCLAKKKPLCFMDASLNGQLLQRPCPFLKLEDSTLMDECLPEDAAEESLLSCQPLRNFLERSVSEIDYEDACDDKKVKERSDLGKFSVPHSLIDRWGKAMDIVYPDSKRCCCFKKLLSLYQGHWILACYF
ncbi:hypothetical protein HPP92_012209 [Vanilla planifolia]|uniref:Uncharacterized protein n=1 Tax=Vanilla planifolia TaxID=51239 RepID=A0A835R9Z2_VANPL|nr:hypothetical protein HPP92_012209 [Vanilla planifolia]